MFRPREHCILHTKDGVSKLNNWLTIGRYRTSYVTNWNGVELAGVFDKDDRNAELLDSFLRMHVITDSNLRVVSDLELIPFFQTVSISGLNHTQFGMVNLLRKEKEGRQKCPVIIKHGLSRFIVDNVSAILEQWIDIRELSFQTRTVQHEQQ